MFKFGLTLSAQCVPVLGCPDIPSLFPFSQFSSVLNTGWWVIRERVFYYHNGTDTLAMTRSWKLWTHQNRGIWIGHGTLRKVQEFPSSTVAPQAVAPPDGNKKSPGNETNMDCEATHMHIMSHRQKIPETCWVLIWIIYDWQRRRFDLTNKLVVIEAMQRESAYKMLACNHNNRGVHVANKNDGLADQKG